MSRLEFLLFITCGLIGGTLGYVTESYWTAIITTAALTVTLSAAVGRNEDNG